MATLDSNVECGIVLIGRFSMFNYGRDVMLNLVRWPVQAIMVVVVIVLLLMPFGGLFFLLSLAISGFFIGLHYLELYTFIYMDYVWVFLNMAWKVYVGVALFTLWIMVTFSFQHCCVGLDTFTNHLKHHRNHHWETVLRSVTWPYALFVFDRNLRGWGISWFSVSTAAIEYWIPLGWLDGRPEGTPITSVNMQTGTVETVYADNPEEVFEIVQNSIKSNDM